LKKILQETLIRQKERVKLDLLADASLRANKDRDMLRNMKDHNWARNKVCKARIRNLKANLKKASKRQKRKKEHDRLHILTELILGPP